MARKGKIRELTRQELADAAKISFADMVDAKSAVERYGRWLLVAILNADRVEEGK